MPQEKRELEDELRQSVYLIGAYVQMTDCTEDKVLMSSRELNAVFKHLHEKAEQLLALHIESREEQSR